MNNRILTSALIASSLMTIAFAQQRVIFSTVSGANNTIPSFGTDTFNVPFLNTSSTTSFNAFGRPFVSPNGDWFAVRSTATDIIATGLPLVVVGQGLDTSSYRGGLKLGSPMDPVFDSGLFINRIEDDFGIDSTGRIAFAFGSGSSVSDRVGTWNGTAFLESSRPNAAPDWGLPTGAFRNDPDSVHFANGIVSTRWRLTAAGGATTPQALFRGNTLVALSTGSGTNTQTSISAVATAPNNAFLPNPDPTLRSLVFRSFRSSSNGANVGYFGTLNGTFASVANPFVFVYNGNVVAQAGQLFAGVSTATVNFIIGAPGLEVNNFGYAIRFDVSDGQTGTTGTAIATRTDFVVRNGQVMAKTGDLIAPGAGLNWDDTWNSPETTTFANTFTLHAMNEFGEMLIGGRTINSSNQLSEAIVFINAFGKRTVIAKKDDGVDLNNNNTTVDDNATISSFDFNASAINNSNYAYITARITAGTNHHALLRYELPLTGDVDNSGEVDAGDIDAVIADFGSANDATDLDGTGEVDAADIDAVIAFFGRTR